MTRSKSNNRQLFSPQKDQLLKSIYYQQVKVQTKCLWQKISQLMTQALSIQISRKQCQNRFKNYLDQSIDPNLELKKLQKKNVIKYYFLECCTNDQIKQKLGPNMKKLAEIKLKNCYKGEKQRIGRVLGQIYCDQLFKWKDTLQLLPKKDLNYYRIFLILFSKHQLFQYYKDNQINFSQIIQSTLQYRKLMNRDKSLKGKLELNNVKPLKISIESKEIQQKMAVLSESIKKFMKRLMIVYDNIPDDKEKYYQFSNPQFEFKKYYARFVILGHDKEGSTINQIPISFQMKYKLLNQKIDSINDQEDSENDPFCAQIQKYSSLKFPFQDQILTAIERQQEMGKIYEKDSVSFRMNYNMPDCFDDSDPY